MHHFQNHDNIKISLIFSTRSNEIVEQVCNDFDVKFRVPHRSLVTWEELAMRLCKEEQIEFIVLAGFLKKVPLDLIKLYPNRIVNIHPSLLPKFGGKGMYGQHVHQAVIEAKEKKSGITIHCVNEEFDEGEIISQFEIELCQNENVDSLTRKIHSLEMKYFPVSVEKFVSKLI